MVLAEGAHPALKETCNLASLYFVFFLRAILFSVQYGSVFIELCYIGMTLSGLLGSWHCSCYRHIPSLRQLLGKWVWNRFVIT